MSLPLFLRGMEDANFHLLNTLDDRPIRIAAIDVCAPDRLAPCRVFDFNADAVEATPGATSVLRQGLYPDELDFRDHELLVERDDHLDDRFAIRLKLNPENWGRFFDCELPPFNETDKISDAVSELCHRNEVEWHFLNWAVHEEEGVPRHFRARARTIGNDELVWCGNDIREVLDAFVSADAIILGVESVIFPDGGENPQVEAISDTCADIRAWQETKNRTEVLELAKQRVISDIERNVADPYRADVWYCVTAQKEDVGPPTFFWVNRPLNGGPKD